MHEARARKTSDVIGEAEVLVKNHTKVADRRICSECVGRCRVKVDGNRWIWDFFKLLTEAYKYKLSFGGVQAQEICCHPGGDLGDYMEKMFYGVREAPWRE